WRGSAESDLAGLPVAPEPGRAGSRDRGSRELPRHQEPERRHHRGRRRPRHALMTDAAARPPRTTVVRVVVAALLLVVGLGVALWFMASNGLPQVSRLAHAVPARTSLMRARAEEAARLGRPFHFDQRWMGYEQISPTLRRAVLIAEDDAFFSHDGLDWNEIKA